MVIIEDLHWGTGPLVEVLARVLSDAAGPVLLLGTMRPDGAAFPEAETLTLERLADGQVAELAESALAGPLDSHALELVAGHADGNPFFAEEVLADLLDRGFLSAAAAAGRFALRRSISASPTPSAASSPPASTCCRPRRRRRCRPPR